MGEGEQRPKHVAHFVLQRVAEQQRVEEQRVVEDGCDLQVLWKTAETPPLPQHLIPALICVLTRRGTFDLRRGVSAEGQRVRSHEQHRQLAEHQAEHGQDQAFVLGLV